MGYEFVGEGLVFRNNREVEKEKIQRKTKTGELAGAHWAKANSYLQEQGRRWSLQGFHCIRRV